MPIETWPRVPTLRRGAVATNGVAPTIRMPVANCGRCTGADVYALCADAWTRAAKRTVREREREERERGAAALGSGSSAVVVVRWSDFGDALAELTPSLTDADLARYRRLREEFEGDGRGREGGR